MVKRRLNLKLKKFAVIIFISLRDIKDDVDIALCLYDPKWYDAQNLF